MMMSGYMSREHTAKQGFTLVELMIAIAILAIIVFVAAPNIMGFLESSRVEKAKQDLKTIESTIMLYNAQIGKYPERIQDLVRAPSDEKIKKKWGGPYLKGGEVPEDAWGNEYQYKLTSGGKHQYELYSFGKNGPGAPQEEWINVWSL